MTRPDQNASSTCSPPRPIISRTPRACFQGHSSDGSSSNARRTPSSRRIHARGWRISGGFGTGGPTDPAALLSHRTHATRSCTDHRGPPFEVRNRIYEEICSSRNVQRCDAVSCEIGSERSGSERTKCRPAPPRGKAGSHSGSKLCIRKKKRCQSSALREG